MKRSPIVKRVKKNVAVTSTNVQINVFPGARVIETTQETEKPGSV